MTRRGMVAVLIILAVGLAVGGVVGRYAFPREVVKEVVLTTTTTTTESVTKTMTATTTKEVLKEVPKEVIMKLGVLAEKIRSGEVDVGEAYGMALGQRYHTIHATTIGLKCTTCHSKNLDTQQKVFSAQDVSPKAPAPVDRRVCLGCHLAGPGRNIYGSGGP